MISELLIRVQDSIYRQPGLTLILYIEKYHLIELRHDRKRP